jgi:putative transposase
MPLLTDDSWREPFSRSIQRACERHRYQLLAFVYMPEHVHLLVWPRHDASRIEDLLRAIKRPYSAQIKQRLREAGSSLLGRLTIRQRPGVMTFRYWQEGPGYDRNLVEPDTILAAIKYIHMNPVRRGLCLQTIDWRWSSARWYADPMSVDAALPRLWPVPAEWLTGS